MAELQDVTPPTTYAPVIEEQAWIDPASAALISGTVGIATGAAGAAIYKSIANSSKEKPEGSVEPSASSGSKVEE